MDLKNILIEDPITGELVENPVLIAGRIHDISVFTSKKHGDEFCLPKEALYNLRVNEIYKITIETGCFEYVTSILNRVKNPASIDQVLLEFSAALSKFKFTSEFKPLVYLHKEIFITFMNKDVLSDLRRRVEALLQRLRNDRISKDDKVFISFLRDYWAMRSQTIWSRNFFILFVNEFKEQSQLIISKTLAPGEDIFKCYAERLGTTRLLNGTENERRMSFSLLGLMLRYWDNSVGALADYFHQKKYNLRYIDRLVDVEFLSSSYKPEILSLIRLILKKVSTTKIEISRFIPGRIEKLLLQTGQGGESRVLHEPREVATDDFYFQGRYFSIEKEKRRDDLESKDTDSVTFETSIEEIINIGKRERVWKHVPVHTPEKPGKDGGSEFRLYESFMSNGILTTRFRGDHSDDDDDDELEKEYLFESGSRFGQMAEIPRSMRRKDLISEDDEPSALSLYSSFTNDYKLDFEDDEFDFIKDAKRKSAETKYVDNTKTILEIMELDHQDVLSTMEKYNIDFENAILILSESDSKQQKSKRKTKKKL